MCPFPIREIFTAYSILVRCELWKWKRTHVLLIKINNRSFNNEIVGLFTINKEPLNERWKALWIQRLTYLQNFRILTMYRMIKYFWRKADLCFTVIYSCGLKQEKDKPEPIPSGDRRERARERGSEGERERGRGISEADYAKIKLWLNVGGGGMNLLDLTFSVAIKWWAEFTDELIWECICWHIFLNWTGQSGDPSCIAMCHFRSWLSCFKFVLGGGGGRRSFHANAELVR